MNITSITFTKPEDYVPRQKKTKANQNVRAILENMAQKPGIDLYIAGDDVKQFERYSLQRALNRMGKKIEILSGESTSTHKPYLQIHYLNDQEWAARLEELKARAKRFSDKRGKGKGAATTAKK